MRIALCLSGQPRTWRHTWRTAFDFFAGHAVDVFIHTWEETDPADLRRGALPAASRGRIRTITDRGRISE